MAKTKRPDPYWSRIRRIADKEAVNRTFKMQHYAGEVYYDTLNWCVKNNANLADEVEEMLAESIYVFPHDFMAARSSNGHDSKSKIPATIMEGFTNDLTKLMGFLNSSKCTFVRCIKSNTFQAPDVFHGYLVLNQLRYTGMMDALRIRKLGWPFRLPQDAASGVYEWMDKYSILYPHKTERSTPQEFVDWLKAPGGTDPSQRAYQASWEEDDTKMYDLIMVGKTYVFMKDDVTLKLDEAVRQQLKSRANTVQSVYRASKHRLNYLLQQKCAGQLGPVIDGVMARADFMKRYASTYERQDRHEVQELALATLQRQLYYQRKAHYSQMELNIARLAQALEQSVISSHKAYADRVEADAKLKQQELDAKVASMKKQIQDAGAGQSNLLDKETSKLNELKARAELKTSELAQARTHRVEVKEENSQALIAAKKRFDEREQEWEAKKTEARREIEELLAQITDLTSENQGQQSSRQQEAEAAALKFKQDQEAVTQKQSGMIKQIGLAQNLQQEAKDKSKSQAEAGERMLVDLDHEEQDLEAKHVLEIENLAASLRAQNWKLAQLHLSEQKTAAEFKSLGLALPSNRGNDIHAQADHVDVLDTQISVLKEKMAQSKLKRDRMVEQLAQSTRAKEETRTAYDKSLKEAEDTVQQLAQALDKERKVTFKLEQAAAQPAAPRVSRFDRRTRAPEPAPAPTTVYSARPQQPAQNTSDRVGQLYGVESTRQPTQTQAGLQSLSSLYKGHGTVHVKHMENLDSATLGAALALLK